MKILIVEDDFGCRKILQRLLSPYGDSDIAVNGKEAVSAFIAAHDEGRPYDLICLDIMMPEMDGQEALAEIRRIEEEKGIHGSRGTKIIMTTALDDSKNIMGAFKAQCDGYVTKPIEKVKLLDLIQSFNLV